MKGYFNNPELKRSSIALLIILLLFSISNYMVIKMNQENLKKDYIKILGGVTAKVIEINPQLEGEIVPLMTREISNEEGELGKQILRQYGLSEELEVSLFPYIRTSFRTNIVLTLLVGVIFIGLLFILNFYQHRFFYNSMREFSVAAKRIVKGDYDIKLSEINEGDLSKLTQAFNLMGEVIRGTIFALKKERLFLVDLLSDISHQLKTPLSTMILYNDILLSKELTSEQRETFLKNNQSQLNRMRWLIQNLLKLAKIDANAIELEMEEQSLNETLLEVIEILETKAEDRSVIMKFDARENIYFKHDRLWLQEALINIVKNGIEHSYKNEKVLIGLEDNPAFTRITVINTGERISEEDIANIFKRFYKGKHIKKRDSIGIGLALAKSIIEKHGGIIEVRSNPDKTCFMITFLKY